MSSKRTTVKRLFSYVLPYKWRTAMVIGLLLLVITCTTIMPYIMKFALDTYVMDGNQVGLLYLGILLVILVFLTMLLSRIRILMMGKITNTILLDIRKSLFTHIQLLGFKFFDNKPVGNILSRIVGDVNALENLLNNSIVNLIPNIFTIVLVLVIMFVLDVTLSIICLLVMPFLFAIILYIEIKAHKLWLDYRTNRSSFLAYTHEAFSGIRITQSFAKEPYVKKRYNKLLDDFGGGFLKAIRLQDFLWPSMEFGRGVGIVTVFVAGYFLIQDGKLELSTLIVFILCLEMLWFPILDLAVFYNAFITNLSAAERIFDILDTKPDHTLKGEKQMPRIKGEIHFDHVTFSYDDDDKHALKDISFKINPGEKIALVGETGSGKTTITNLISKFYTPSSGTLFIDGLNIEEMDTESIRSQMGIMLQDSFLFSSSIKENILYGKLDATDEEIIEACKAVNAHAFIEALENGYDTNVNERGSRLSQGQRQLIAFARALIADPKILILDEATANIDTQTERLVQQGIQKLMAGRTSIVIAHRLSTIRDCDKIFVLSHGKIVESGTHDTLLLSKGYYYNLYRAQYKFLDS